MQKKVFCLFVLFLVYVFFSCPCFCSMSSTSYRIDTYVISGGGALMCSSSFCLNGTLGQPSPITEEVPTQSAHYNQYPGFWYTIAGMPMVCNLAAFAGAFGSVIGESNYSASCDMDTDGDVDGSDVAIMAYNL